MVNTCRPANDMSAGSLLPVTVVVPVRDEAAALGRLLPKLSCFARVIVVESSENPAGADVARRHGAEFVVFEWQGGFPKKRTWAARQCHIATEWTLFLDADEEPTAAVVAELGHVLRSTSHDGFWLAYDLFFLGRRLRFGVPQRKIALIRTGRGEYERIEDRNWTDLDMEVHEHIVVRGSVGKIKARLLHREEKTVPSYCHRHADYAAWEARRYLALQEAAGTTNAPVLTVRQRVKYRIITAWWFPAVYFLFQYVVRLGFLDGVPGLLFAQLKAAYFVAVQAAIVQRDPKLSRGDET